MEAKQLQIDAFSRFSPRTAASQEVVHAHELASQQLKAATDVFTRVHAAADVLNIQRAGSADGLPSGSLEHFAQEIGQQKARSSDDSSFSRQKEHFQGDTLYPGMAVAGTRADERFRSNFDAGKEKGPTQGGHVQDRQAESSSRAVSDADEEKMPPLVTDDADDRDFDTPVSDANDSEEGGRRAA